MKAAALAAALFVLVSGCSGRAGGVDTGRRVLEAAALSVTSTEGARIEYQARRDETCRGRAETYPEWRACMEPVYRIDQAVGTMRGMLLASEASLDAAGADGWIAMAPCLVAAAVELSGALAAAGVPVPDAVDTVAALAASVAGDCSP